ncbi:hypothetical protein AKJ16_DCAP02608 [Drosera capensis]
MSKWFDQTVQFHFTPTPIATGVRPNIHRARLLISLAWVPNALTLISPTLLWLLPSLVPPPAPHTMMMAGSRSLISKVYDGFEGSHFVTALSSSRTNESDLVIGLLQILQGNSSSHFYWDKAEKQFHIKAGIHVAHLSLSSLYEIVNQFLYAATYLWLVEMVVNEIVLSTRSPPTLSTFVYSVSSWLKRLRDIALAEEVKINGSKGHSVPTLLGMPNSLSSLLPYIESIDSLLYEGILNDPFNEMFFFQNKEVSINDTEFWEKSYLWRSPAHHKIDIKLCSVTHATHDKELQLSPLFIKYIAGAIVSAGKTLQLIRHSHVASDSRVLKEDDLNSINSSSSACGGTRMNHGCSDDCLQDVLKN